MKEDVKGCSAQTQTIEKGEKSFNPTKITTIEERRARRRYAFSANPSLG